MSPEIIFILLLILALFVESTLVNFPLVLVLSLYMVVVFKSTRITIAVFLAAFSIDALRVVPMGTTPMIVSAMALFGLVYQRSLHFADILLLTVLIGVVTVGYSMYAGYGLTFFPSIIVFTLILVVFYRMYDKKGILTERNV